MDQNKLKIARKFKLTAEEVEALFEAGLDTPTKIKEQARTRRKFPKGIAAKLRRYREPKATG